MGNFLENPEERIALFGDSTKKKLSSNNQQGMKKDKNQIIPKRKKNEVASVKENVVADTIQIRISREVEQQVREILLNYSRSTGKRMGLREFADRALIEYAKIFEKESF